MGRNLYCKGEGTGALRVVSVCSQCGEQEKDLTRDGKGVLSMSTTFLPAFHFLAALNDNQPHKTFPCFKGLLLLA